MANLHDERDFAVYIFRLTMIGDGDLKWVVVLLNFCFMLGVKCLNGVICYTAIILGHCQ